MDRDHGPTTMGDRSPRGRAAPSLFECYSGRDVIDLIAAYPLAWVCARDGDARNASLLPLLPEVDGEGRLVALLGHMANANALVPALTKDPRALLLFNGPHGYISPEFVSNRSWAPTWNYAQARIEATILLDRAANEHAVETLVETMERDRDRPWTSAEMGPRYAPMMRAIIAFRAIPTSVEARFKLGQDEQPHVLREILNNRPSDDLSRWMLRFNEARLAGSQVSARLP